MQNFLIEKHRKKQSKILSAWFYPLIRDFLMNRTQLVDFGEQDFVVKVAWTLEDAVKLLGGGFQFVCDYNRGKIFRKPK
jgi:hypothetical protein